MTANLVIGLDSYDPMIAKSMAKQGELPVLASLMARGSWTNLMLPDGVWVGTVWPVLTRQVHPAATGRHSWINVDPETYELIVPDKRHVGGMPFWVPCLQADRSVLVIDLPHSYSGDGGIEAPGRFTHVCEWGTHDHDVGFETNPAWLAEEIDRRYDRHPLLGHYPSNEAMHLAPDDYLHRAGWLRTPEEDTALASLIEPGITAKGRMVADLVASCTADLSLVVFGEAHAVGHQLWHVHDPSHPRHHAGVAAEVGSPVQCAYKALDRAMGDLIQAAQPRTITVLLSHGMAAKCEGTHLLEPVLGRLDGWFRRSALDGSMGTRLRKLAMGLGGWPGRGMARTASWLLRRGRPDPRTIEEAEIDAASRRGRHFFRAWNNDVVSGVRINLQGREGDGLVEAAELDSVLTWLEENLRALINVDTGRRVVRRMYRADTVLPPQAEHIDFDPYLPDLYIEWDTSVPIERVWSPGTGEIHHVLKDWRTGQHVRRSAMLRVAPDVTPGRTPRMEATSVPEIFTGLLEVPFPTR